MSNNESKLIFIDMPELGCKKYELEVDGKKVADVIITWQRGNDGLLKLCVSGGGGEANHFIDLLERVRVVEKTKLLLVEDEEFVEEEEVRNRLIAGEHSIRTHTYWRALENYTFVGREGEVKFIKDNVYSSLEIKVEICDVMGTMVINWYKDVWSNFTPIIKDQIWNKEEK